MKINITLELSEFYNDFEDFDQWFKRIIKDEILKKIKNTPEWQEFINKNTQKIIDTIIKLA